MNLHTQIAILVAPFLLIGGYVATDYYLKDKAEKNNLFKLNVQGNCNILNKKCTLINDKLKLDISDNHGVTQLNSNYPLETVTFSIVDDNQEFTYKFNPNKNKKNWQINTVLTKLSKPKLKIRLIAFVNEVYYFGEFYTIKNESS
jgi:hypothetical protein